MFSISTVRKGAFLATMAMACMVGLKSYADHPTTKPAADMSQMDPEKMMAAMQKMAEPGPEHQKIAEMAGTWAAEVHGWMPDGKECPTSMGKMQADMVMGGRYLLIKFDGEMVMPDGKKMPYKGEGIYGYDKAEGKYFQTWMDTMSTGVMITKGKESGSTVTLTGSYTCPMTHQDLKMKQECTKVSKDNFKFTMYNSVPGSSEMFKCMEINYTRKG